MKPKILSIKRSEYFFFFFNTKYIYERTQLLYRNDIAGTGFD